MSQLDFSSQHEAVVRSTEITNETPGAILHDFQVLLDFVAEASPQLTDAHMLPLKLLRPLNEQFMRRIEHGLARPQQKSYPHINGLFLLLRASGLTLVDTSGRKPVLVVDPFVADSWSSLNADERYFTLLESWLMRGDSEIIGERSGRFTFQHPLRECSNFFGMLARQERHDDDWTEWVRYWPGLHHLALMELFGLVTVEDGPAEPQRGWRIADVRATELGEALLSLLTSWLSNDWEVWNMLSHPQDIPPGVLQPFIQLYRPEWQHTLQLPNLGFQEGLFVFKVSLREELWRMISLPAQSTLEDLSDAILDAYQFDKDHLYRFLYPTRFGLTTEVDHPEIGVGFFGFAGPFTDEVRIGDLPAQPGFRMKYNFDFGDNWMFDVLLERIDPPDAKAKRYRIGKRQGKSPEQYPDWDDDDDDP